MKMKEGESEGRNNKADLDRLELRRERDAEVGGGELRDGLLLGFHDVREGGVARFVEAVRASDSEQVIEQGVPQGRQRVRGCRAQGT